MLSDLWRIIMVLVGMNSGIAVAQQTSVDREFEPLTVDQVNMLKGKMGDNKKVLPEFQEQIFHTLSYFPELKDTHIRFKYQKIGTTLNARPTVFSLLFKSKKNRRYVVRINSCKKDSTVQFSSVSYNAQIGVLAHEFSHFVDYSEKGLWGIFKRLLSYTNKRSKKKFEHEIDQLTIERGLGWQLYDWAHTVLYESDACYKYKKLKQEVYLTPRKIANYLSYMNGELQPEVITQ